MLGVDPLVISWSATSEVVEEKKEEKMQQMKCLVLSLSLALLIVGLLHLQLQNEVALLKANQVNMNLSVGRDVKSEMPAGSPVCIKKILNNFDLRILQLPGQERLPELTAIPF